MGEALGNGGGGGGGWAPSAPWAGWSTPAPLCWSYARTKSQKGACWQLYAMIVDMCEMYYVFERIEEWDILADDIEENLICLKKGGGNSKDLYPFSSNRQTNA